MIFEQEAEDFSQIKEDKLQEYFVYFKVFHPQSWEKDSLSCRKSCFDDDLKRKKAAANFAAASLSLLFRDYCSATAYTEH